MFITLMPFLQNDCYSLLSYSFKNTSPLRYVDIIKNTRTEEWSQSSLCSKSQIFGRQQLRYRLPPSKTLDLFQFSTQAILVSYLFGQFIPLLAYSFPEEQPCPQWYYFSACFLYTDFVWLQLHPVTVIQYDISCHQVWMQLFWLSSSLQHEIIPCGREMRCAIILLKSISVCALKDIKV